MKKEKLENIDSVLNSIDRVLSMVNDDDMLLNPEKFFYNIGTLINTYHIDSIKDQRQILKEVRNLLKTIKN